MVSQTSLLVPEARSLMKARTCTLYGDDVTPNLQTGRVSLIKVSRTNPSRGDYLASGWEYKKDVHPLTGNKRRL